jgi:hypothetical protein
MVPTPCHTYVATRNLYHLNYLNTNEAVTVYFNLVELSMLTVYFDTSMNNYLELYGSLCSF